MLGAPKGIDSVAHSRARRVFWPIRAVAFTAKTAKLLYDVIRRLFRKYSRKILFSEEREGKARAVAALVSLHQSRQKVVYVVTGYASGLEEAPDDLGVALSQGDRALPDSGWRRVENPSALPSGDSSRSDSGSGARLLPRAGRPSLSGPGRCLRDGGLSDGS